jgi:hypothetical protein
MAGGRADWDLVGLSAWRDRLGVLLGLGLICYPLMGRMVDTRGARHEGMGWFCMLRRIV